MNVVGAQLHYMWILSVPDLEIVPRQLYVSEDNLAPEQNMLDISSGYLYPVFGISVVTYVQ